MTKCPAHLDTKSNEEEAKAFPGSLRHQFTLSEQIFCSGGGGRDLSSASDTAAGASGCHFSSLPWTMYFSAREKSWKGRIAPREANKVWAAD